MFIKACRSEREHQIYSRLFYTWGSPDPARPTGVDYYDEWPIEVNGKVFLAKQNLYDAINMLCDQMSIATEQPDQLGQTRLMHALTNDQDLDIVRQLLHNGADIAARSESGKIPSE